MSIDIEVSRHSAETLALVVVAIASLFLVWVSVILCNTLIDGKPANTGWTEKGICYGACFFGAASTLGVIYISENYSFGTIVSLGYVALAVISNSIMIASLFNNVRPNHRT